MTLVTCPECKHFPLSTKADRCPKCGCSRFSICEYKYIVCPECNGTGQKWYEDGFYSHTIRQVQYSKPGITKCRKCNGRGQHRKLIEKDLRLLEGQNVIHAGELQTLQD